MHLGAAMSTEVALRAENDQLRAAISTALRIIRKGSRGVVCPACGAKSDKPCWGNGPRAVSHEGRRRQAMEELEGTLKQAVGE